MWGISIPINLYTILAALFAPVFFLVLAAKVPWVAGLIVLLIVALVVRRRRRRLHRAEDEALALEAERRAWARANADEFARRWGDPRD